MGQSGVAGSPGGFVIEKGGVDDGVSHVGVGEGDERERKAAAATRGVRAGG